MGGSAVAALACYRGIHSDLGSEAARLRRISPFDIVLTPPERRRVYAAFAPAPTGK